MTISLPILARFTSRNLTCLATTCLVTPLFVLPGAIANAATVLSSVHYQRELILTCASGGCGGDFPKVAAKRRLTVTRMTCRLQGSAGSTYSIGWIDLRASDDSRVLSEYLPVDHSGSNGIMHTLNRAVDMQVAVAQHMHVSLNLVTGTAIAGNCTATGTLDTLQ